MVKEKINFGTLQNLKDGGQLNIDY